MTIMKLRYFLFSSLLCSNLIFVWGSPNTTPDTSQNQKRLVSAPYSAGEILEYSVSFGFYTGAKAYLTVSDSMMNGIKLVHAKALAQTIGISDYLFKIRDRYETFINPQNDLPILSIRDIKEGRYRHYNEVTYNRDSSKVTSLHAGIKSVPEGIQDILSVFMFGRKYDFNDNLRINQLIVYRPYFCDSVFTLTLKYRGLETVKTNIGDLECYKFSMCEEQGNQIITRDDMSFWLTRDENKIPVKVQFKIVVGSFVVEIEKATGLKSPLIRH